MSTSPSRLIEDLAKSVTTTTSLLEGLLGEIRDHSTSLAVLQNKLASIGKSVSSLSTVVREGNGTPSIVTRLALLEKEMEDVAEEVTEYKKQISSDLSDLKYSIKESNSKALDFGRQKSLSVWKLLIVISPGLISLIMQIVNKIVGE